jgi:hypothetical protein
MKTKHKDQRLSMPYLSVCLAMRSTEAPYRQGCLQNPGHFDEVGFDTLSKLQGIDTTSNFDTWNRVLTRPVILTRQNYVKNRVLTLLELLTKCQNYWPTHKKTSLRPDHPAPQAAHPKPITGQEDPVLGLNPKP